jgi:hypothetical protein
MKPILIAALSCTLASARAATIGVDIGSHHFPEATYLHDVNPGLYVRLDNGATGGFYLNSLGRLSLHAGYTAPFGPFALTVGIISGYQIRHTYSTVPCGPGQPAMVCTMETHYGDTRGAIGLLLAPSVALPSVFGVAPRLTVLPKLGAEGHTAVHLSLEHTF